MLQIEPFPMFPSGYQVVVVGLTVVLVFTGSSLAVHVGQDPVNEVKRAEVTEHIEQIHKNLI